VTGDDAGTSAAGSNAGPGVAAVHVDAGVVDRCRGVGRPRGTIGPVVWLWVLVIVVLIGALAVLLVGSEDSMAEVYDDRPDVTVPIGRPLHSDDLLDVRFSTAVRGYRMDEVDALLARVRADLLARESREDALPDVDEPGPTSPETPA
jgi:DivIVA domain-containing protein